MRTSSSNSTKGFTLLEVLIALAVLAIASSGILYATNENIKNSAYLDNRTLASWIAHNKMEELRLEAERGLQGGAESLEFAERRWSLVVDVSGPDMHNLQRINITVSLQNEDFPEQTFAEIVGYAGTH